MRLFKKLICFIIMLSLVICVPIIPANAKPTKPTLQNSPMNGQILPFYEVWLRWYDVPDEAHYTMTIRDLGMGGNLGDSGPLIYNREYVAQNSTYFVVPTSKLIRGHHYRWCINSVDANGNRTIADNPIFAIETDSTDSHFITYTHEGVTYPMRYRTNTLEYFVYAESTEYDTTLNQAVQAWNGIANVTLVRTATPSDNHYEVRVFESPDPADPNLFGRTTTHTYSLSNGIIYVNYSEVTTYKENIQDAFVSRGSDFIYINNANSYYMPNAMHEIGHALLLTHSYDGTEAVCYTVSSTGGNLVPLIMNSGESLAPNINVSEKNHIKILWGE